MTNNIETTDLHTLLDSLTDGEHIKATWTYREHSYTVEGPVRVDGDYCACFRAIRWNDGTIVESLTAFEVTRTEEINRLNRDLHSVTTHRTVVHRWEREKKAAGSAMSAGTHTSGHTLDLHVDAFHDRQNHDRATCTRCQLSRLLWGEKS